MTLLATDGEKIFFNVSKMLALDFFCVVAAAELALPFPGPARGVITAASTTATAPMAGMRMLENFIVDKEVT